MRRKALGIGPKVLGVKDKAQGPRREGYCDRFAEKRMNIEHRTSNIER
jgi:hypothetical protein